MSRSILPALRSGTAAAHQELETFIDMLAVCSDLARYRNLLGKFLGFYEPLERRLQAMEGWESAGFNWSERRKVDLLRADLTALGMNSEALAELLRCADFSSIESLAAGFGCAYVLEGATLGGRQIRGMLEQSPIPPTAWNFFSSYGSEVGTKWREFCQMLEDFPDEADESMEITQAATETFQALLQWLKAGQ